MTTIVGRDNFLLEGLDADTRAALGLVPVELRAREVLSQPGMPVLNVYFPVSGMVSLVSTMRDGATAEVALVGHEGMVGLAGVLGGVENPTTAVVQIPGMAFRTTTGVLKAARLRFSDVRFVLDRYTQARLIQVAQTAACNSVHAVEARLARWLLAADDRLDGRSIALSQELVGQMLGVQRPTVSTALHRIREAGAITYRGRAIVIADRSQLEHLACECYSVLRREFDRLHRTAVSVIDAGSRTQGASPSAGPEAQVTAALEGMRQIAGRLLLANLREQEAREDAEAANRAKDQFLAMVSHELRSPLTAILGWCAILNGPGRDSVEHGVHVIQRNAAAQLKLVQDLLDAARVASSTLTIRPAAVDLSVVLQDAADVARPLADEKRIMLRLAIGDELSLVADADRLRQVFVNVMTNAVKFTDDGGSVDIAVMTGGHTAHVTVRDTGHGIAPDVLPHVFEPFRQGPLEAGANGLGLGLAIARAIVQLHGGRIEMASPGEGLGATCTIDLPLRATRRAS